MEREHMKTNTCTCSCMQFSTINLS
jgi:hypothetical protein